MQTLRFPDTFAYREAETADGSITIVFDTNSDDRSLYVGEEYQNDINDIEVKGDFKVYLTSNGVMPDTSVPGGKVSQDYVLPPGGKVMFSSFTSNGNSLDYDFDDIVVIANMEPRTEEEIKDEPVAIMDDITFKYAIENNVIKGKLTNHNETYTTSNIFWM